MRGIVFFIKRMDFSMRSLVFLMFGLSLLLVACTAEHVTRENITPGSFQQMKRTDIVHIEASSPFLKAHLKNGNLYIFDSWKADNAGAAISGHAMLYGPDRKGIGANQVTLGLDSIAIIETNSISNSGSATAFTVFTGITAAFTAFCITNPKACFGSCPTFYVSDGDSLRLQAEGFSSSIAPSLEATDVDALYNARVSGGELVVEMRNEALETHVVRSVNLLAVPKEKGQRIFAGENRQFWQSNIALSPLTAVAPEGDCLALIRNFDGNERFSLADETYLGAKEEISLEFKIESGKQYGLVIGSRQTLLPTYLLYQALAYMGNDAGYWFAEIERKKLGEHYGGVERLIGGIEVLLRSTRGFWRVAGRIDEHGPLASDVHLLSLGNLSSSESNIKLRLTKGAWRIDYIALAELSSPVTPIMVHPKAVMREGWPDEEARAVLLDSAKFLVTLPGDTYTLQYEIPKTHTDFEFFLQSRGYYLEWIRKEWIEEQNPRFLAEMFLSPDQALRRIAPEFKQVEPQMEDSFWRSRYAKP